MAFDTKESKCRVTAISSHGLTPAQTTTALDAVLVISRLLSDAHDPIGALDDIARRLGEAIDAHEVLICLVDSNDQTLRIRGSHGAMGNISAKNGSVVPWVRVLGDQAGMVADTGSQHANPLSLFSIVGRGIALGVLLIRYEQAGDRHRSEHADLCQSIANLIASSLAGIVNRCSRSGRSLARNRQ